VKQTRLALEDQVVALIYPEKLQNDIETLFGKREAILRLPSHRITIREQDTGGFSLQIDDEIEFEGLDKDDLFLSLIGEVVQTLITEIQSGVAIHAGAVSWNGKGIILPGTTGAGKSCFCAWLAGHGFKYLSDECVVLRPDVPCFTALPRPLILKEETSLSLLNGGAENLLALGAGAAFWPKSSVLTGQPHNCHLVLFPRFASGSEFRLDKLSPAQAALELMACNVNARNLPDHGFGIVTAFAQEVPAIKVEYGAFQQLQDAIDAVLDLIV